ncbi:MAG: response regulator [Calditrichaeota bacterium]|nr:MAG: response regulator [Calditrichota bacterium]MBL1204684.1 response regulator [Calditrichota bacterium]NOG44512.1 hypothetical protein [Calditrichota bacterium]
MLTKLNEQKTGNLTKPIRILFAHQDEQVLTMLSELFELQTDKGQVELGFTNNGQQFLKKLSQTAFDIVVLDENLSLINFPKVFHDLARIYPHSKVLFLMDSFDEQTFLANDLCNIQFIKKPFTQKAIIKKIAEIVRVSKFEMRNINPACLLLTLAIIKGKAAICLLNDETGDSAEVFIENKIIKYVTVEKGELILEGFKALNELLEWNCFESRYSDAPFPDYKNLRSDSMETLYSYLQSNQIKKTKSVSAKPIKFQIASAEKQQRLRELLAHVPQYFDNSFIMNAFCDRSFDFYAQLKNPKYNEVLYRIGDSILEKYRLGMAALNNGAGTSFQAELPNLAVMKLHKINDEIWYLTILSNQSDIPSEFEELVNTFSDSIPLILNSSINMYEFLN